MATLFLTSILLYLIGCANIVPPRGGPEDRTPPILLSEKPADSILNTKVKKIELVFNKYINIGDYSKELRVSPILSIPPLIQSFGKKVVITIQDSLLEENTTYTIHLGNAIKDNRESTPYPNYTYTFSTGPYFDSLTLTGRALEANTGKPTDDLIAVLYLADNFNDSMILRTKPMYIANASGSSGAFTFTNLPDKAFKLFVLKDVNGNMIYEPGSEKIGFIETNVSPSEKKDYLFYVFQEGTDTLQQEDIVIKKDRRDEGKTQSTRPVFTDKTDYLVLIDTMPKTNFRQDLNKPIKILMSKKIKNIDEDKVYLTMNQEGVAVEAIRKITKDDSTLFVQVDWRENTTYTLRLINGWATDSLGANILPGRYTFQTHSLDHYAKLSIRFPDSYTNGNYYYRLIKESDTITQSPILDSIVNVQMLSEGSYNLDIFEDKDKNGTWSTGDYFAHKQPEIVITNNVPLLLKPGWEHEYTFEPANLEIGKMRFDESDKKKARE